MWLIVQAWVILNDVLKTTIGDKCVSLNLVSSHRASLGGYREIGDARAHNDLLDDRTRRHRFDHRRRSYPHVFAPEK